MSRTFSTPARHCCILIILTFLLLTACSNPKEPAPIAQETVTTMIGKLAQGDLIQIATHYQDKPSINAFMKENEDRYSLNDTYIEDTDIVEDYTPNSPVYLAGFSIGYEKTTEQFKNLAVGLQQSLTPVAESLLEKAVHTAYQKKKDSGKIASKQSYYLGYMRLGELRRLDITLEQTTTKDLRNLYSFFYEVVDEEPAKKK